MNSENYNQDPNLQQQIPGSGEAAPDTSADRATEAQASSADAPHAPPPPPPAQYLREDRKRLRKDSGLPYKSPALALWLSSMPGLGQVYVGYYQLGFQYLLVAAGTIAILNMHLPDALSPLFGIFLAFFWVFNMLDAHKRAHHYNRALDGLSGEELPDDFKVPGAKGSMPAGVILVIIGTLAILDMNTDFTLEWLEDWWPLGLVVGGLWLILKARRQAK